MGRLFIEAKKKGRCPPPRKIQSLRTIVLKTTNTSGRQGIREHGKKQRAQHPPTSDYNTSEDSDSKSSSLKLEKSSMNVSAGGIFYEKVKSRRARHRLALRDNSETAVPLGKAGSRGPNRTSSITMARHEDGVPSEKEDALSFKSELRVMNIRHKFKMARARNESRLEGDIRRFRSVSSRTPAGPRMQSGKSSINENHLCKRKPTEYTI
jgi:hypothetical protein